MNILESIKARKQIETMYQIVRSAVPTQIGNELKLLRVRPFQMKGNDIMRGRIVGRRRMGIWNSAWCFYEIGIGFYEDAPPDKKHGGIGLVSYPGNKKCGDGKHRATIIGLLAASNRRNRTRPGAKFKPSDTSKEFQGAFEYYSGSQFRSPQAIADLADLISNTFEKVNRLAR